MQWLRLATIVAIFSAASPLWAQSKSNDFGEETDNGKGPKLGNAQVELWKIGVVVTAGAGPCTDVNGYFQVPVEWPEQKVKVVEEDFTPFAQDKTFRMVDTVRELAFTMPQVPAAQEAKLVITYEITRFVQSPPDDTKLLKKTDPKKLPKDIRRYLGPSPRIESQGGKIKALAKKLAKESEGKTDWERVEAIFQYVRENVKPEDGPKLPGALQALRDKASDHEGFTSLFVALCRASDVPARTVWVPKTSYPEFYLTDDEGEGHWYPCWLAEPFMFGGTPTGLPIWQKGDNFHPVDSPREQVRYLASKVGASGVKPDVRFVRELIGGAGQ